MADVIRTDEKGSDVNLATFLLIDGVNKEYEEAIVVSNDSDLVEPIRFARNALGLEVGILNPQKSTSFALQNVASFCRKMRKGILKSSQFPPALTDQHGTITKPAIW